MTDHPVIPDTVLEQAARTIFEVATSGVGPINPASEWSSWERLGEPHKAEFRKQAAAVITMVREIIDRALDESLIAGKPEVNP
jgi:2-phosphoglycerate kinase